MDEIKELLGLIGRFIESLLRNTALITLESSKWNMFCLS